MVNVLFVDNDPASCKEYKDLLEKHGYRVRTGESAEEAQKKLKEQKFDLAIIDIRLKDDREDKDISGLILAKETAHFLPKIILTNHPSEEATKQALQVFHDGIPAAITIIRKGSQYYSELLESIQTALKLAKVWHGVALYNETLQHDYKAVQDQSSKQYKAAFWWSVVGATIIFLGIGATIWIVSTTSAAENWILAAGSLIGTLGGVVTEVIGLLFFRRVDVANQRMDRYHGERIAALRFDILFNATDNIADATQAEVKKSIILQASRSWLGGVYDTGAPVEKELKP